MKTTLFALAASAVLALTITAGAQSPYFPPASGDWAHVDPAKSGWNPQALDAALDYARAAKSSGVVVLLDGRILAERDWPVSGSAQYTRMHLGTTKDGHTIEDVASAQKSIVSFLAGVAEGRGQLNLAAPVTQYLGNGWSQADSAAERAITVRHLMTMTSGLSDAGVYQQPAGEAWRYNTGMYSKMIGVLEKATGTAIDPFTRSVLTGPAGMNDSKWVTRPWAAGNDAANAIGFVTTPRDLARFGLLILNNGSWSGTDLLHNPTYLSRMLKPSQALNPSYGLLWWLNGQPLVQPANARRPRAGTLISSAPKDLVAALGALDRKCYVVPSLKVVVTRLGDQTGETFDEQFWALLMKAAPAR